MFRVRVGRREPGAISRGLGYTPGVRRRLACNPGIRWVLGFYQNHFGGKKWPGGDAELGVASDSDADPTT